MNQNKVDGYLIKWNNFHSIIFSQLISRLTQSKIRYFILRNFEGLPDKNNSKDIDIIIESGSYKKTSKILFTILKENNVSNLKVVQYERVHCCFGIDVDKNFSIHIDLIEGYFSKGFEVFSFEELYGQTVRFKNFRVLTETYDVIMLLYYKVISTKLLNKKYQDKINFTYKTHSNQINGVLQSTLSKKMSGLMIKALSNQDFDIIIENAIKLSKVSKQRILLKKPFRTTYGIAKFLFEKIYRIVYCPRKYQNFISVQGADGTGKSTFIDGLVKAIAFYNVSEDSKSHVYHHRPTVLPNLSSVGEKAGLMKGDKDFTNPHRAKPAGFVSSFIRMTYYWMDYVIGVPLNLRKDVQFDRFTIYDFLIDPHRSKINLPYWLRKIFTLTVIQPRLVFVLLTDAQTIYKRKQELTIDEINRQLGEFSKLAKSHKRFIVIDASKLPEEMVEDAIKVIINNFTEKL
jgi:thymidylate kinase